MQNIKRLENLTNQYEYLQSRMFDTLEIESIGMKTKTGKDACVKLFGKPIHTKLGMSSVDFDVNSESSKIVLTCCRVKNKVLFNKEKDIIEDYTITITTPIKKLHIDYNNFTLISDNTSLGTHLYYYGKEVSHIASISTSIGDADTITEMTICVC